MKSLIFRYYLFSFVMGLWFAGPILIPFYKQHIGINQFQIQFIQAFFMVVLAIVMVPTGVFADKYGRKKSIIIGLGIGAIAGVWYGLARAFATLLFIEILFALNQGFISGADLALLTDGLRKKGKQVKLSAVFSTAFIAHMLGLLVANPIGRYVANFGLHWPVILTFIPMVLSIFIIATFKESKGHGRHQGWLEQSKRGVRYLIVHPEYGRSTVAAIITSVVAYFVIWLYVPILEYKTNSLTAISVAFAAITAGEILIALAFRRLSNTNQHRLLVIGRWFTLLGFLAVTIHQGWVAFAIFIIGAGSFGTSLWSLYLAYIQQHLPGKQQASIVSGAEAIRIVLLIVLNLVVGWLALHHPQPALIFLSVLAAIAVVIKPRSGV